MSTQYKVIGIIVLVFHLVGAVGTIIPGTRELVLPLTPLNLVLSSILLIYGHQGGKKWLFYFLAASFTLGYLIEVVGVKTGFPFGEYSYGSVLGPKLFEAPLTIGLNWFMLSYLFGMLASQLFSSRIIRVLSAAFAMMVLDLLIEPVAIHLDYWQWEGAIPFENYLSWLVIGGIQQLFYVHFDFKKLNPLVIPLLVAQILYFGIIFFTIKF